MQIQQSFIMKQKPLFCISTVDYNHQEFPLEIYYLNKDFENVPSELLFKITTFEELIHFFEDWY